MNEVEPPFISGCEYYCSGKMSVVPTRCQKCADCFALKLFECFTSDVRCAKRVPYAGEVVNFVRECRIARSDRVGQDGFGVCCAFLCEAVYFSLLRPVRGLHDSECTMWFLAIFLNYFGGILVIALIKHELMREVCLGHELWSAGCIELPKQEIEKAFAQFEFLP